MSKDSKYLIEKFKHSEFYDSKNEFNKQVIFKVLSHRNDELSLKFIKNNFL
jgi:hypothetical protein